MSDFTFLQNPLTQKWVISAPRRATRPDVSKGTEPVCPFCLGREKNEDELYRVGGEKGDAGWQIRVLANKFPFAPIHEVIIHSPDHHKNFEELPLSQSELIFQTYRNRYLLHQKNGQVYIFHNHGEGGGESLPHPHTQVAVVPFTVKMDIPRLDSTGSIGLGPAPLNTQEGALAEQPVVTTQHFSLLCPETSQWPDEVWVLPMKRGRTFGEITDGEITDLAKTIKTLIHVLDLRHGHEFPFNFYIYPGGDWYLRLIPRQKLIGGFEVGTGIYVNTQDPKETMAFLQAHFFIDNLQEVEISSSASYSKHV